MLRAPGTKLGPYAIVAPLGAGGMGEVYRARDSRLERDVAVKILPEAFAADAERMARFEREAKVLAALNHPNIAAIYGLEENALIMELVEGENLPSPLPLETALAYARQIAEGLEAAPPAGGRGPRSAADDPAELALRATALIYAFRHCPRRTPSAAPQHQLGDLRASARGSRQRCRHAHHLRRWEPRNPRSRTCHERANCTLAALVRLVAEETERDFTATGSTTFLRQDLKKGFEPDSSFYFRHAAAIRGKDVTDMATDPPPELIIEVDITSSSLNHFPLYAAIGISEIWRYDGHRVRFHRLEGSAYAQIEESAVLPPMTSAQATIFIERDRHEKAPDWLRAVRQWIRARITETPA